MIWTVIAVGILSALLAVSVMLMILRFNQLSMARSLCDEAKRQLLVELRARHALVPTYIGTLQQITTRDLRSVELALASAERAPFGPRGAAAENALTRAIDDAAHLQSRLGDTAQAPVAAGGPDTVTATDMRDELDTTVELLHGQLSVLSERIVSVARIYNANVDRYHRQRGRLTSRLFGRVFHPRVRFADLGGGAATPLTPGAAAAGGAAAA